MLSKVIVLVMCNTQIIIVRLTKKIMNYVLKLKIKMLLLLKSFLQMQKEQALDIKRQET